MRSGKSPNERSTRATRGKRTPVITCEGGVIVQSNKTTVAVCRVPHRCAHADVDMCTRSRREADTKVRRGTCTPLIHAPLSAMIRLRARALSLVLAVHFSVPLCIRRWYSAHSAQLMRTRRNCTRRLKSAWRHSWNCGRALPCARTRTLRRYRATQDAPEGEAFRTTL